MTLRFRLRPVWPTACAPIRSIHIGTVTVWTRGIVRTGPRGHVALWRRLGPVALRPDGGRIARGGPPGPTCETPAQEQHRQHPDQDRSAKPYGKAALHPQVMTSGPARPVRARIPAISSIAAITGASASCAT